MKAIKSLMRAPTYWQLIFLQSKVNGASYKGEALSRQNWDWPKDTYFQRRMQRIKFKHQNFDAFLKTSGTQADSAAKL